MRSRCCCCSAARCSPASTAGCRHSRCRGARRRPTGCRSALWREAIDMHFPNSAWIRMSRHTLDELQRFKNREALPTWDATIAGPARRGPPSGSRRQPGRHEDGLRAPRARPQGRRRDPVRGLPAVPVPRVGAEEPGAVPVRGAHAAGLLRRPTRARTPPSRPSAWRNAPTTPQVLVTVRFLQLQHRTVQEVPPDGGEPRDVGIAGGGRHRVHVMGRGRGTAAAGHGERRRAARQGAEPGVPHRRRGEQPRTSPTPMAAGPGG